MNDIRQRQKELVDRFNALRESGICSPTTRSLLDDAQCLLAEALDEPAPADEWQYGIKVRVPDGDFGDDGYGTRYELRPMNFYEINTGAHATHRRRKAGPWEPVS
jgi:hypothetical protein